MISLIARFLRPYRSALIIVVILLTMQVIANLYLPFLNADIINNGVVTGDIGYIVELGAIMLAISLGLGVVSVIAVADLTTEGRNLIADTFMSFEVWFTVAGMYLVLTLTLSAFVSWLEHRTRVRS